MENFTEKAKQAIILAQAEARRLGHNFVGTESILLGIIAEEKGVAANLLKSLGITLKDARIEVEKSIGRGSGSFVGEAPFTQRASNVVELSYHEASQLNQEYVDTQHLLLALICEGEGVS
ncbi:MAG: Clp protease N-terminal domain-containing protein, partial [Cyanobacteria bacterium J06639_18]